ncbi:RNA-binding protein [archaeon]|nr:RNA-binding protein [archaeon]
MGEIKVKDKEIVVPGQELATGMDFLPGGAAFREGEKIIASQLGLISVRGKVIRLIPLTGKYVPKVGDIIIGRIIDMNFNGWVVDIGCSYDAVLSIRSVQEYVERDDDLTKYYSFNDIVVTKITKITRSKLIDLTTKGPGLMKLVGGNIIEVTPSKVPRVIGKQGSMIDMIKKMTNCRITVGQNGRVWIQGDIKNTLIATKAIRKIERESHTPGLTDKIKELLEKETKK